MVMQRQSYSKYDSIMLLLKIEGKVVYENNDGYEPIEDVRKLTPIDYSKINTKLAEQRKLSKKYLKTPLAGLNSRLSRNS